MYFSYISILGNVGSVDFKKLTDGREYVVMSVAVRKQKGSESVWYRVNIWDKQLELFRKLGIAKGTAVFVSGLYEPKTYNNKEFHIIQANSFELVSPSIKQNPNYQPNQQNYTPQPKTYNQDAYQYSPQSVNVPNVEITDEDLPF